MRKSRGETAQTRERIIACASALFRERGLDNVSVAGVMARAGLTHGGFYAHFASREELVAEAIRYALVQSAQRIYLSALKNGDKPGYSRLIKVYLTAEHRDTPDRGCVIASLGPEIARSSAASADVFSQGFGQLINLLAQLSPERNAKARKAHVLSVISALSGALILARSVTGEQASEEILDSVRLVLLADEKRRQGEFEQRRTRARKKTAQAA